MRYKKPFGVLVTLVNLVRIVTQIGILNCLRKTNNKRVTKTTNFVKEVINKQLLNYRTPQSQCRTLLYETNSKMLLHFLTILQL